MLSGITHPNPNTQNKVRYLNDYFDAAIKLLGKTPEFHPDNHLHLLEELLFHLEPQRTNPFMYVDLVLHHFLWDRVATFTHFQAYAAFESFRTSYCAMKEKDRKKLVKDHRAKVIVVARPLFEDLRRKYVEVQVKEMISYLKCSHDLDHHIDELNETIRTIVSVMLMKGHNEKELLDLFDRVMKRNPKDYPFPKRLLRASIEEKTQYLSSINFKEQFKTLRYAAQKPKVTEYFIFRCINIHAPVEFDAKYDQVQFLHAENKFFDQLKIAIQKRDPESTFLKTKNCVYAIVRTRNNHTETGARIALSLVRKEVEHLRAQIGEAFHLDLSSYLTTTNLKDVGWRMAGSQGVLRLHSMNLDKFKRTFFAILRRRPSAAKRDFLRHEILFSKAAVSMMPSDYWAYVEVLTKGIDNTVARIDRLGEVGAISQPKETLRKLKGHLYVLIMNSGIESIGITSNQYDEVYKLLLDKDEQLLTWLEKHVNRPIIKRIVGYARKAQKSTPDDYVNENRRMWSRAYGQRNSIVHDNEFHEASLRTLELNLPANTNRLRWAVVHRMIAEPKLTLPEVIEQV